jgi:glycogen operon protein
VNPAARNVLILIQVGNEGREFTLPRLAKSVRWRLFIDTMQESPHDIYPELNGPAAPAAGRVWLDHHSLVCFVSEK